MIRKGQVPAALSKRGKGSEALPAEEVVLPETGSDLFTYSGGLSYNGEWKRFDSEIKRHGKGVLKSDAYEYDGEFCENRFHGQGIMKYADGSYYKGHFEHGAITGHGEMHFKDGSSYSGEWMDGRMNGIGTYITDRCKLWTGPWSHGMSVCPLFPKPEPEPEKEEEEEEEACEENGEEEQSNQQAAN